jgi:hypothetical protein
MFDNLDDPTPPPPSAHELARVRARAAAIRAARRRTFATAGSSACAVAVVVGAAAVVAHRHSGGANGVDAASQPTPAASSALDRYGPALQFGPDVPIASAMPAQSAIAGLEAAVGSAGPAVSSAYPAVTSPMVVQSFAPATAPATPDPATIAAAKVCSADEERMVPTYVPPGLKAEYPTVQGNVGSPGSLAIWSWSDDPAHLSKQTVEFDVGLFCQGHAEFGVTGGDGNRVVQDITIHGKPAILWHEYNDTVVGIEFNWAGYGWVQVESEKLANGQPAAHRLSDSDMLAIAQSLPAS